MVQARQRWENDDRGYGVADGEWIARDVARLLDTLSTPDWITEAPELHLLPHLERACAAPGSPWTLIGTLVQDAVFIISLTWEREHGRAAELRADAFALLGQIAESVTYIHQRVEGDAIVFDAVTGMLDEHTHFRSHGHLVQLRIAGAAVQHIVQGMS